MQVAALAIGQVAIAATVSAPRTSPAEPLERIPSVIGEQGSGVVVAGDTLLDVAARNRVGFEGLQRLNPHVDAWSPVAATRVSLPTRAIPPVGEPRGLVLNLPEMRLYDYTVGSEPRIIPVAIGAPATPSPLGLRNVDAKAIDPVWRVPPSIRALNPALPREIEPGPGNPLGRHWLGLGDGYGIHGTNNRWSIGRATTHGCIRLWNDDVAKLYARVAVGSPVRIVYETVKIGRSGDDLFVEAHPDVYGIQSRSIEDVMEELASQGLADLVVREVISVALQRRQGIPIWIGSAVPIADRRGSQR